MLYTHRLQISKPTFFKRKKGQFLISQNISVYSESIDFTSDSYFIPLENNGLEVIRNNSRILHVHDGNLLLIFLNFIPSRCLLSFMWTSRHAILQSTNLNDKKVYFDNYIGRIFRIIIQTIWCILLCYLHILGVKVNITEFPPYLLIYS